MAGQLHIGTFGGLSVRREGAAEVAGLGAKTAAALLVYLAASGRPVARSQLAEVFWPDQPEESARTNLRSIVHRLRRVLGADLVAAPQAVALAAGVRFDAALFEESIRHGRVREAWTLYTGEFMSGFYLDGSPTFESWLAGEQVRYLSMATEAGQQVMNEELAAGGPAGAATIARRLLELDPAHEVAMRALLRSTAASGRRKAALELFERFRLRLLDEVGAEPEPATVQLVEAINRGEVAGAPEAGATDVGRLAPPPAEASAHARGGSSTSGFVGRARETAELNQILSERRARLVTLHGPGGTGKTRLAAQLLHLAGQRFATSAFVPLEGVVLDVEVATRIGAALGLQPVPEADPITQVVRLLAPDDALLVLDNLEQLTPVVVGRLLAECPNLTVVATSRRRLDLAEEHLYPVAGLALPSVDRAPEEGREPSDAEKLFLERARQAVPGFAPGAGEADALAGLCRLLQGLPLAIELAASWVRVMSCAQIVTELKAGLDLLKRRGDIADERHGSMRSVFESSWRLLDEPERRALAGLSVFQNGFDQAAAAAVAGVGSKLLGSLSDKSLLQLRADGRFGLHPLSRRFAREKLALKPSEEELTRERHGRWYLRFAREHEAGLWTLDRRQALALLEPELGNLRAAWSWAVEKQEADEIAASAWAFDSIYQQRLREARAVFAEAAEGLDESDQARQRALGHVLIYLAHFQALEEGGNIRPLVDKALGLLRPLDDQLGSMRALVRLGFCHLKDGDRQAGLEVWREGLALARAFGTPRDISVFLTISLGVQAETEGETEAQARAAAVMDEVQRFGTAVHLTHLKRNTGWYHLERGELERADQLFEEALALARQLGIQRLEPLGYMVGRALKAGDMARAEAEARRAVEVLRKEGTQREELDATLQLARVLLAAGSPDQALHTARQALRAATEGVGTARAAGFALLLVCECALALDDPETAAAYLGAGAASTAPPSDAAQLDAMLGRVRGQLGDAALEKHMAAGRRVGVAGLLHRDHEQHRVTVSRTP